jgi:hypothetical protein
MPRMHGLPIMASGSTVMHGKPAKVRVIALPIYRTENAG